MITHYDLFAGIGGNSIAVEEVFYDEEIKHIFCEWESFPTAVLKQHWPDGEYWGDIADIVTHTNNKRLEGGERASLQGRGAVFARNFTIVTGGFPCQPFSHAGRRRGTADDRYQWPNMLAVIRNVKPEWVIAENVRGLVTWNDGMVLETICSDLESEGYEVQPLIIPAVAVGAPHRRDRVWIIAHNPSNAQYSRLDGAEDRKSADKRDDSHSTRTDEPKQSTRPDSLRPEDANRTYTKPNSISSIGRTGSTCIHTPDAGTSRTDKDSRERRAGESGFGQEYELDGNSRSYPDWSRNWQEVAFATCNDAVDDGLPRLVDGVPYSRAKWRKDSLKAYGNGIVPQIMMEIFRAIKLTAPTEQKGEQ
jgi:DNA (cytosine-5)-methyltransferase 1